MVCCNGKQLIPCHVTLELDSHNKSDMRIMVLVIIPKDYLNTLVDSFTIKIEVETGNFFPFSNLCNRAISHFNALKQREHINSLLEQFRLLCQKIAQWTSIKTWLGNQPQTPAFVGSRPSRQYTIENM